MRSLFVFFTILLIFLQSCKSDNIQVDQNASQKEQEFFEDYRPSEYKWGYLDLTGRLVIEDTYDAARDFSEDLAAVNQQGKWGFIDKNGNIVISFQYRSAGAFSCERALVQDFEFRQFYIDKKGNEIIYIEGAELNAFIECKARINKYNRSYFINSDGEVISDTTLLTASNFRGGYAIVQDQDGYNIIDNEGTKLLNGSFDKCYSPSDGMVRIKEDEKIRYISLESTKVSNAYTNGTDFHNGVAAIERSGWNLIDKSGKVLSENYDFIQYVQDERWTYYKNGKCGILDNEGSELTPAIYDIIYHFNGGVTAYSKSDLW